MVSDKPLQKLDCKNNSKDKYLRFYSKKKITVKIDKNINK